MGLDIEEVRSDCLTPCVRRRGHRRSRERCADSRETHDPGGDPSKGVPSRRLRVRRAWMPREAKSRRPSCGPSKGRREALDGPDLRPLQWPPPATPPGASRDQRASARPDVPMAPRRRSRERDDQSPVGLRGRSTRRAHGRSISAEALWIADTRTNLSHRFDLRRFCERLAFYVPRLVGALRSPVHGVRTVNLLIPTCGICT
jgi:hypothetical protein